LKFKMKDSALMRTLFGLVQILTDEAELKLNNDGINIRHMDPSRVAMVDTFWPKSAFEEYASPKEPEKVRLNLIELMKLLRRAGKDEAVELELDANTGKIQVRITGKYSRNFTLPSLEADEEDVPTPKITFNSKIKLVSSGINQAIEDTQLVSDHVKLVAENDLLRLNAVGDLMTADIKLAKGNEALLDISVKEPCKATYSLSYIKEMIGSAQSFSETATLEFSTDMPAKLSYEKNGMTLTYFMAPRIETE